MKNILLLVFMSSAIALQTNAQNSISLNINHKLIDTDFAFNQASENNLGHPFKVTRLEYYISEISIFDNQGIETFIDDLWILVDASTTTNVNLGQHSVDNIDKIVMHIGVDIDHNHLDPATYEETHPLALKFPSMHWGWSSGYRFIAIEGSSGPDLNQLFQIHGLGDDNYTKVTLDLNTITSTSNQINIDLDANYAGLLENIQLNSGFIVHGEFDEAKICLLNFRRQVYSQTGVVTSTIDYNDVENFEFYPNPVVADQATLKLDLKDHSTVYDLVVTTVDGRQVQYLEEVSDGQIVDFSNNSSGIYVANLTTEGQTILTKKILVK